MRSGTASETLTHALATGTTSRCRSGALGESTQGLVVALQALADNGEDAWDLPTGRTLVRKLHPPGMLGNEVISGNATCSTWFYADHAFWLPQLAPG